MTDLNVLLERADLLLDQGRYKDAEAALKKVLEQEPENDYALALLSRCYLNNKRHGEGITVIQRAIALNPENSFYFYLLAFGCYHQNQLVEAEKNLQHAIRLFPYNAEYFGLLAYVFIDERQFEKALETANEGLAVEAENSTCLNARSTALNKLGRINDAIETMRDALAQAPDNEMTHATVAWNLLEKGNHKEATHHFLAALRIDPNYATAKIGLKEALKSEILPYKWLLQYSFWVQNKGKRMQAALPIILYIVFRLIVGAFNSNENMSGFTWIIIGAYLLFVVTSWTIGSIANFFLLFHPVGKHALTTTERWSAISVVAALSTGLLMICLSKFTSLATGTNYEPNMFFAALVYLSLALPLGEMEYPVRFNQKSWRQWYTLLLTGFGILTLLLFVAVPSLAVLFLIYGLSFIVYNWIGVTR